MVIKLFYPDPWHILYRKLSEKLSWARGLIPAVEEEAADRLWARLWDLVCPLEGGDSFHTSGFHFDEESPSFRPHSDLLSPGFKLIYVHPSFSHLVCISVSLTKPAFPVGCDAFSQELTHKIVVMFAGVSSGAYSAFLFTFSAVVLIILLISLLTVFSCWAAIHFIQASVWIVTNYELMEFKLSIFVPYVNTWERILYSNPLALSSFLLSMSKYFLFLLIFFL